MMRIAIVAPELQATGGTERCTVALGEALQRRGHQITVFSSRKDTTVLPDARWHYVPMLKRPHAIRFFSFLVMAGLVRAAVRVATRQRFDVVHSTGPDVLQPTVSTLHCCCAAVGRALADYEETAEVSQWTGRMRRRINRVTYGVIQVLERYVVRRGAAAIIVVSRRLQKDCETFYGVPAARCYVVHDGIDLNEFNPAVRRCRPDVLAELGIPGKDRIALFVGHNWERKGLSVLTDAVAQTRTAQESRVHLVVVGGSGQKVFVDYARRRLGARAHFVGTQACIARYYGASDVLVLPSLQEAFGLPVLEAMACGLPVVVSHHAGVAELITDGESGLLLKDPTSSGEIASKIETCLNLPEEWERLARGGLVQAVQHSWDAIAERTERLYWMTLRPEST